MSEKKTRQLAAIMFTDIVGYSAMMHANESEGRIKANRFRQVLKQSVQVHGGEIIQHYGDGSLSIFPSAVEAVDCAQEIQLALQEAPQVPLRVGLHVGDIVVNGQDIYGDGVNIASRVESMGVSGSVLMTERIASDVKSHPQFEMTSLGLFKFKNISRPMEVFALANEGFPIPNPRHLKGKGRAVNNLLDRQFFGISLKTILLSLLIVITSLLAIRNFTLQDTTKNQNIKEERVAISAFQNFTLSDSLKIVGDMTAHWLTKGLYETNPDVVVDYESVARQAELLAGDTQSKDQFSLLTGAVNVIEGSYTLFGQNQDSLVFTALIKDLKTGQILHSFKNQYGPKSNPINAINDLASHIKGYWASKSTNITAVPNYDAYKAFLAAKQVWNENPAEAEQYLNTAIRIDSSFYDSYFLLLPLLRNQNRQKEIKEILELLKSKMTEFTTRQKNLVLHSNAIANGENVKAYEYYLKEYEINPKDLFFNTSAMVYALEYVNAPEKAIEFFEEIPMESLDLNQCKYCVERIYVAMLAYMKIEDYRSARKLAAKIPLDSPFRGYYIAMTRVQAHYNNTTAINEIIQTAAANKELDLDYRFMYYQVAEDFKLQGNEAMMKHYADIVIESQYYKRTVARAHVLLDQFDIALQLYSELLLENPNHLANRAQIGVIYAKKGEREKAQAVIAQLEAMKTPNDHGMVQYQQAKIYAQLGNEKDAIEQLGNAIAAGIKFFYRRFENDLDFLALRDNQEFQRVIHPLNTIRD